MTTSTFGYPGSFSVIQINPSVIPGLQIFYINSEKNPVKEAVFIYNHIIFIQMRKVYKINMPKPHNNLICFTFPGEDFSVGGSFVTSWGGIRLGGIFLHIIRNIKRKLHQSNLTPFVYMIKSNHLIFSTWTTPRI